MKHTWRARIGTLAIAACLAFSSMPVFADGAKQITVHFEDVTASDTTTQYGEAKIKVSISGANGNTTVVQNAFTFDGMDYKSARFLKGENDPPAGVWYAPTDIATVNSDKKFTLGIASSGIIFGDNEEVYIITFYGEPGEAVTLSVADDLDKTYCVTDGDKITAAAQETVSATASDKGNKSIDAVVKLTMDKVTGFNAAADTGITLKITSENTPGYVITNTLSNKPVQDNGHRENSDIPTFTVKNSVLAGDKYTVELFEKDKDGNLSETPASSDKFTYEINEKNGYLFVKSSVLGEIRINASCANGSELKETVKLNVNRQSVSLFDIVMFVIGLYLLYSAISGRGRIFDAEFVKEGMEAKHKKAMRISCLAAAVIMIAAGVVSALDGFGKLQTVSMILFGLLCAVFVAAIIWTGKYVDKNAKREAQQQPGGGVPRAPKAAFEFDDDEPTIDDVKK